MSQEERLMILQMVADKKISAVEAAELLKALGPGHKEPEPASEPTPAPPFRTRPIPPPPPPVLTGLGSFIENVVEMVTGPLSDAMEPRYEFPAELTGEFAPDEVQIRIVTGSGRVVIQAWDGQGYQASIVAKASGANEEEARAKAASAYTVKADATGFDLEAKRWDWGGTAVHVVLLVPKGKTYRVEARTGNGAIEVEGLAMSDTKLDTGNGSIHVSPTGSQPQMLRLRTGNGSIAVRTVKVGAGAGFKVEAHTGLGRVNLGLPSLIFDTDVRHSPSKTVVARTVNFETAAVPVTILAWTGMGSVTVD